MSTDALSRRFVAIDATDASADDAARTVAVSISSELAVQTRDGLEVLDHSPEAVDLTRAAVGLPLLRDHDPARLVGVVEGIRLERRRLIGRARFGVSPEADAAWADVRAGVLRSLRVGYRIDASRDEGGVIRVTRWTPYECSLVALPAGHSVGVGRSLSTGAQTMTTPNTPASAPAPTGQRAAAPAQPRSTTPNPTEAERTRASEIARIGSAFAETCPAAPQVAQDAIRDGISVTEFRGRLLDAMGDALGGGQRALANPLHLDLSRREAQAMQGYSVSRGIRAAVTGDWRDAGIEREANEEIAHKAQRSLQGFYVPSFALARRDLLTSAELVGGALNGIDHLSGAFIEALRAETQVIGLGRPFCRACAAMLRSGALPRGRRRSGSPKTSPPTRARRASTP
jgi:hypothetical protein